MDNIITVLWRSRLRWYGRFMKRRHWVGKCMDYEVEGVRLRGRPKKTWREVEKNTVRLDN